MGRKQINALFYVAFLPLKLIQTFSFTLKASLCERI